MTKTKRYLRAVHCLYQLVWHLLLFFSSFSFYARSCISLPFHSSIGKPPITFGKLLILSFVMLLWVLAIVHFLRTWRKKMTLRPTYDMTSSSGVTSSYDVINPCHTTHSYSHIQAQRPNSFTTDLSHQASGSSLQCKTRESTSRSITDLQAIIPEDYTTDTLSSLDQPSSSKITYCRS